MGKIGILTFHFAINNGAILQAIALQNVVKKVNNNSEVMIINYQPRYHTNLYKPLINPFIHAYAFAKTFHNKRILYRIYRFIRNVVAMLIKCKNPFKRWRKYRIYKEYYTKHLSLTELCISSKELSEKCNGFDVYIVGSDQLWNSRLTNYQLDLNYYLSFLDSEKSFKVSYAVSANFKENETNIIRKYLNRFDCISVREETTKKKLCELLKEKIIRVDLDPTMLLSREEYQELEEDILLPQNYIAFYGLETEDDSLLVNKLQQITELLNVPVVDISPIKHKIKCNRIVNNIISPGQFLQTIKKADFVITNSFHGTIFSIIYNKDFYVDLPSLNPERLLDLLGKFQLEERIIRDKAILLKRIEWSKVNKRLLVEQEKSISYLSNIITNI